MTQLRLNSSRSLNTPSPGQTLVAACDASVSHRPVPLKRNGPSGLLFTTSFAIVTSAGAWYAARFQLLCPQHTDQETRSSLAEIHALLRAARGIGVEHPCLLLTDCMAAIRCLAFRPNGTRRQPVWAPWAQLPPCSWPPMMQPQWAPREHTMIRAADKIARLVRVASPVPEQKEERGLRRRCDQVAENVARTYGNTDEHY